MTDNFNKTGHDKVEAFGYLMTSQQELELKKELSEDILFRYDHPEYWDWEFVEQYACENKLKPVKRKQY